MSELIARCAKVANWRVSPYGFCDMTSATIFAFWDELTPAGTLFLIRALLGAHWELGTGYQDGEFRWYDGDRERETLFGPDLNEVTCRCYLAAFEPATEAL